MKTFTVIDQINAINKHCVRNNLNVHNYEVSNCVVFARFEDYSYLTVLSIVDISIKKRLGMDLYDNSYVEYIIKLTA